METIHHFRSVDGLTTREEAAARPGLTERLQGLPFWWLAAAVMAAGMLTYATVALLEPTPANPELASRWYVQLVDTVFLGAACLGTIGLLQRRSLGFVGISAAAWLMLTGVVGCPLSGHHHFGFWWVAEFTVALAFAVFSTYAARAARRAS